MKNNLVFTKDEIIQSLESVGIELIDSTSTNTVQMISDNGSITELSYDFNVFDDVMLGINVEYVARFSQDFYEEDAHYQNISSDEVSYLGSPFQPVGLAA